MVIILEYVTLHSYSRNYGEANSDFEYIVDGVTFKGTPEIICDASVTSQVGSWLAQMVTE